MNKILITTVGGSCAPVVNAVRMGGYDHVFFVCSTGSKGSEIAVDGDGKPCKEMRDGRSDMSIVAQTGLSEDRYTKWALEDPDNLGICYQRLKELRGTIRRIFGRESHVVANYTGGTAGVVCHCHDRPSHGSGKLHRRHQDHVGGAEHGGIGKWLGATGKSRTKN